MFLLRLFFFFFFCTILKLGLEQVLQAVTNFLGKQRNGTGEFFFFFLFFSIPAHLSPSSYPPPDLILLLENLPLLGFQKPKSAQWGRDMFNRLGGCYLDI